jgi:hypothetical protein
MAANQNFPTTLTHRLEGGEFQWFRHRYQVTGTWTDTFPAQGILFLLCSECLMARRTHLTSHEHLEERIIWSCAPVTTHACNGQSLQHLRLCRRVEPRKMGQCNTLLIHPLTLHPSYQVQQIILQGYQQS